MPDTSSRPYSSSRRVSSSPSRRYMEDPSARVHSFWMVTALSRSEVDSTATSAVISLVMLAMARSSWAFFSISTRPLSASTKMAQDAETPGVPAPSADSGSQVRHSRVAATAAKTRFIQHHLRPPASPTPRAHVDASMSRIGPEHT